MDATSTLGLVINRLHLFPVVDSRITLNYFIDFRFAMSFYIDSRFALSSDIDSRTARSPVMSFLTLKRMTQGCYRREFNALQLFKFRCLQVEN